MSGWVDVDEVLEEALEEVNDVEASWAARVESEVLTPKPDGPVSRDAG